MYNNLSFSKNVKAISTFSIVGYDPDNGDLGVAVQSKFFAVGAVVPWAEVGVGAIATQSWANTTYGPRGLQLLKIGLSAEQALEHLIKDDNGRESRQVGIVDASGNVTHFTGEECNDWAGAFSGKHYAAQGNILTGEDVVKAMGKSFEAADGELADKLLAALFAGQDEGGDKRGQQSAALLVVRKNGGYGGFNDRYIDIRVDDAAKPIEELQRLLNIHKQFFSR